MVEFVLLAVLTALQWARHRIRGGGWVALSFAILGGLTLAVRIDPSMVLNENVAKSLIALLLLMPVLPLPLRGLLPATRPSRARPRPCS